MNISESARSCLVGAITAITPTEFSKKPGINFTRHRKCSLHDIILALISSTKSSLSEELRRFYINRNVSPQDAPSKSAFIQQRAKLVKNALPTLFHNFNAACSPPTLFKGYQLLACDESEFAFYSDWDWDARVTGPNGYHAVHLVALYDLISRKYIDAEIQPARLKNEHKAICSLAQKLDSATNKIFVADRGLGSYNFYANAEAADISYVVHLTDIQYFVVIKWLTESLTY